LPNKTPRDNSARDAEFFCKGKKLRDLGPDFFFVLGADHCHLHFFLVIVIQNDVLALVFEGF
jgi:hypothetical protein